MKILRLIAPTALALYVLLQYVPIAHSGIIGIIYSLISLSVLVVLPGMGITTVVERIRKRVFTMSEFLAIASASSLFLVPCVILFSLTALPFYLVHLPLLVLSGISCVLVYQHKDLVSTSFERKDAILLAAIFILIILIWIACHAYYPLPDRDPYSWLSRYLAFLTEYNKGSLTFSDRPGFFAFLFLYNALGKIDAYALLKYVLPLLYTASLCPLWVVARRLPTLWSVTAMTAVFWSASTILYAITPMPQMLFISALFFGMSFLLYARMTGDTFYRYVAGIILVLCIPLYEAATLVFLVWLLVTCWHERTLLYNHFVKNPVALFLFVLLVLTNAPFLYSKVGLILLWSNSLISHISLHSFNLLFPAQYTNVDGNAVGWAGASGIVKYYAYYVGLPVLFILGIGTCMVFFKRWRVSLIREIRNHPETQIALSVFSIFFTISELLPRFFSFALLPERAWVMGGIAVLYPALVFLPKLSKQLSSTLAYVLLILVVPNVAGALYVNYQKQFLITDDQLESASWIQKNLPADRKIISDVNGNLLTFYSQSPAILVSPLFCKKEYTDSNVLLSAINTSQDVSESNKNVEQVLLGIRNSILQAKPISKDDVAAIISHYSLEPSPIPKTLAIKGHYYIYYSANNPNDPYSKRPYVKQRESCTSFVFDENPAHYERVYQQENNIVIWAVK